MLDQKQTERYSDAFARIIRQLGEGHGLLLDSVVESEVTLLAALERRQKQLFLRYKELLDELHMLYQFAAYEAGRKADADISAEALEHLAQVPPEHPAGDADQAESRSRVPADARIRSNARVRP